MRQATVVKHTGSHYMLSELPEWNLFPAVLRGRIRLSTGSATNPVAVGDKVLYELEDGAAPSMEKPAVIKEVLPRKNYIIRRSTNLSRQSHVIAANIDVAFIVVTIDYPQVKLPFLDRLLVTCEVYGVPAVIVLNKIDLLQPSSEGLCADAACLTDSACVADAAGEGSRADAADGRLDEFKGIYSGAGYRIIEVSALTGAGVDELRSAIKGKIALFSGVSGVGKSSLIKSLDPSLEPRVGALSDAHLQGKHTTTFYEMYRLGGSYSDNNLPSSNCTNLVDSADSADSVNAADSADSGFIIDTPGIRGFGLVDIEASDIALYFPEMLRVAGNCRFTPCTHTHEPGCAVKAAVEDGSISCERYESYLGMLDEEKKYR